MLTDKETNTKASQPSWKSPTRETVNKAQPREGNQYHGPSGLKMVPRAGLCGMLPSILDILGSIPSPAETGWAWWSVTIESPWLHSPKIYLRPWFVVFVVIVAYFVSNNTLYGMCIWPSKQLENWKFVFKKTSHSYLLCQLSPDSVSVGLHMPSDILGKGKTPWIPMSNLPLCSGFIHSMFIYSHLPCSQCGPELDVWCSDTARKQLLLVAPDLSTLDILVSSVWSPPILDLPIIQHSRKLLGLCLSLVASVQLN